MNSFQSMALAAFIGITAFFLIEEIYSTLKEKVREKQVRIWWDEFEEEHWED
jgi:hypothetical protein